MSASGLMTRQADNIYLVGVRDIQSLKKKNQLPTTKEVLLRFHFFLQEKKSVRNASHCTIDELNEIWNRASIPTKLTKHSIEKLESFHSQWLALKKNGRKTGKQKINEQLFVNEIETLFDIAHAEADSLVKVKEDKDFLEDQRCDRKMIITSEDKEYTKKQARIAQRAKKEEIRRKKSVCDVQVTSSSLDLFDDDYIESPIKNIGRSKCRSEEDELYQPSSKKKIEPKDPDVASSSSYEPKAKKTLFTTEVTGALDRNKVSDREAVRLIIPIAAALGHDPSVMALSRSSIKRKREEARHSFAEEMKANLEINDPVVVHWDGKSLPDITGSEIVDRLPVLVSYGIGKEKLLGVPKLTSGTGLNTGNAVLKMLKLWNLDDRIIGMAFDSTAVNTGGKNGACTLIEGEVQKNLLWFACRHHVMEIILSKVFLVCLGPSSSPEILLFKRLKESWNAIVKSQFITLNLSPEEDELKSFAIETLVPILKKKEQPRDDYLELIELCLTVLGYPLDKIHWRIPGPIHQARWMAKLIYAFKLYLFQDQGVFHLTPREKLNLQRFIKFGALLYVRNWVEAPNATDAAFNDLVFWKEAGTYLELDDEIGKTIRKALQPHLWYLSDELVGLSLFSDKLDPESKLRIVLKKSVSPPPRMVRGNSDLLKNSSELADFANERTFLTLAQLNVDTSFLNQHPSKWELDQAYRTSKLQIKKLKVVNDVAERGVKLIQDYNKLMTNDEEEKQILLLIVEANRKLIPTEPTKKSVLESVQKPSSSKDTN